MRTHKEKLEELLDLENLKSFSIASGFKAYNIINNSQVLTPTEKAYYLGSLYDLLEQRRIENDKRI